MTLKEIEVGGIYRANWGTRTRFLRVYRMFANAVDKGDVDVHYRVCDSEFVAKYLWLFAMSDKNSLTEFLECIRAAEAPRQTEWKPIVKVVVGDGRR